MQTPWFLAPSQPIVAWHSGRVPACMVAPADQVHITRELARQRQVEYNRAMPAGDSDREVPKSTSPADERPTPCDKTGGEEPSAILPAAETVDARTKPIV